MTYLEVHELASIQINDAIQHFKNNSYISAITLAGAGEELLGKMIEDPENRAMNILMRDLQDLHPDEQRKNIISRINRTKNAFKHLDLDICDKEINIREEAFTIISRACTNYIEVTSNLTNDMRWFIKEILPEFQG